MDTKHDITQNNSNNNSKNNTTLSYLTLGDGDFTYSLDLCRYLQHHHYTSSSSSSNISVPVCCVTCTGIDSYTQLKSKYRDVDSILRKIRSCHNENETKKEEEQIMSVYIRHGVNAIPPPLSSSSADVNNTETTTHVVVGNNNNGEYNIPSPSSIPTPKKPYYHEKHNIVIFNHPHLGCEDAKRHSQFLSHLFYSLEYYWLKPLGIFYLTLAKGQYERWNCLEAALKHGFVLVKRCNFIPPPAPPAPPPSSFSRKKIPKGDEGWLDINKQEEEMVQNTKQMKKQKNRLRMTYYRHRRHQTGKSFAKRISQSETFVFGRAAEYKIATTTTTTTDKSDDIDNTLPLFLLPWQKDDTNKDDDEKECNTFKCPYCSKSFQEERSRKNHIFNVHPHDDDPKNRNDETISNKRKKKKYTHDPTEQQPSPKDDDDDEEENKKLPIVCKICMADQKKRNSNASAATATAATDIVYYSSNKSLADHVIAKHSGEHTYIQPDWAAASFSSSSAAAAAAAAAAGNNKNTASFIVHGQEGHGTVDDGAKKKHASMTTVVEEAAQKHEETVANIDTAKHDQNIIVEIKHDNNNNDKKLSIIGSCLICDRKYYNLDDEVRHLKEFIPPQEEEEKEEEGSMNDIHQKEKAAAVKDGNMNACKYCNKRFRDRRARMQHENYCKIKHEKNGAVHGGGGVKERKENDGSC